MCRKRKTGGWRTDLIRQDPTESRSRVEISPTQTKIYHTQTSVKKMVKKLSRLCLSHYYTSNPNTQIQITPSFSLFLSLEYLHFIYIFVGIYKPTHCLCLNCIVFFFYYLSHSSLSVFLIFLTTRWSCLSGSFLWARSNCLGIIRAPQFDGIGGTIRKKRSQTLRRPRPEPQSLPDQSPLSPTPLSDDTSKISSDDIGDANSRGKMFNLNQCVSRPFPTSGSDGGLNALDSNGVSADGMGNENKLKKVKLKVGGVTRTIQTNSNSNGASGSASSAKTNLSSDSRQRQKLILQEHSDEYHIPAQDKKSGTHGIPWKGFSKGGFGIGKEDKRRILAKSAVEKRGEKSDPVRKSKRMPKRRVLDEEFDEDDQDDEIRYLEKLKTAKVAGYKDTNTESTRKQRKDGKLENIDGSGKSGRDFKESKPEDMDYEVEELLSDGEPEGKKKKQKKDLLDLPMENKREMALTTRQRALLSKDAPSASGASQIEFPNGLPPAPSRKQKEQLSEMEQQLKKVEIAQRRKMQNEKAARESEAEAIRKILGQDSSRKKREDKVKKRQEELAQEKAASAQLLASSTIRWVMGPTGTTVTFPQDMGFPKIFESKLCSYPPPREKCAGPSCTNPYKYRDSKSKLPICSLQCYKAIHEKMQV